jgi:hypothetical protein
LPDATTLVNRKLIVALAERHRVPAIYAFRVIVTEGGLMSYGIDVVDQYGQAAGYVDRILKGAKPAELPVQLPTKFVMSINPDNVRFWDKADDDRAATCLLFDPNRTSAPVKRSVTEGGYHDEKSLDRSTTGRSA